MLIPMMHSEDIEVQEASLELFERYTNARVLEYAYRHRGYYCAFWSLPTSKSDPGRPSTEEERAFLERPGSSF